MRIAAPTSGAPCALPSAAARRASPRAAAGRRPLRAAAAAEPAAAMATEWASKVVELPPLARGSHVVTRQLLAKLPEVRCSESSAFLN